jgi:predicted O-methyltransferase YrrM
LVSPEDPGTGTAQRLRRVRATIETLAETGTARSRSDGQIHSLFPVATSPREGEALRNRVISEGAVHTVEIGLGYGISTLHICEGLLRGPDPDSARHLAIDPHQATRFGNCGLQFLSDAGIDAMVEHADEPSRIALARMLAEGRTFDLAYVDGNHKFDGVFVDLAYLGQVVAPGHVIFLDDYQLRGVAKAVSFFVTNLGWSLVEVSPADDEHQWAVLRTATEPDTRRFDYFVDF